MGHQVVDNETALLQFLESVSNQQTEPPSLYLDIEGINLCREGTISIIQLFNAVDSQTYLIDVFKLQHATFDTATTSGVTFRSILQDDTVPKVFFDVRNDSDALFALYSIKLCGVHDVQLLKAATRPRSPRLVGLAGCIEQDADLSPDAIGVWKAIKSEGKSLFAPNHGGSWDVLETRPMLPKLIPYCTQDVVHLPTLWKKYTDQLEDPWPQRVREETLIRVLESQLDENVPDGKHKQWAPFDGDEGERKLMLTESYVRARILLQVENASEDERIETLEREMRRVREAKEEAEAPRPAIEAWICTVCQLSLHPNQRENHLNGKKHLAKYKKQGGSSAIL